MADTTLSGNSCAAPSLTSQSLMSVWDGLSPHLIASFYEVLKTGEGKNISWQRAQNSSTVMAPLTESNLEMMLNWQSPFEQAGPESKAPALMAMLQSGALQPIVDAVLNIPKTESQTTSNLQQKADSFLKQFEGRTGITKLNSTQVFTGMPPVKITITALFRAWADPIREVEAPVNKLIEWALPIELSQDASILARAAEALSNGTSLTDAVAALMPSKAPTCIGMTYKSRTYLPLVIESIGFAMGSAVNQKGKYVELAVPMTLCTLTALDRADWLKVSSG